jgi:hypothetical protein
MGQYLETEADYAMCVLLNSVFTMVLIVEALGHDLHHGTRLWVMDNLEEVYIS